MGPELIGVIFLAGMLLLIVAGVPIAFAMLASATVGFFVIGGSLHAETQLVLNIWDRGTSFVLTAIPLYLLMGQLFFTTGLATDLYDCVYKWFGRLPGGLAITSVVAAAGFGAVSSGGSTAVATLGPMCIPAMREYRYSNRLGTGAITAGATLGALIPPSVFLVVYGVWTETSIGALFIAGIIPGLIMGAAFSLLIVGLCTLRPHLGPAGPRFSWSDRFGSLAKLLPILLTFALVVGGIYGGVFDPAEAGAAGVTGLLVIALAMRRLSLTALREALLNTMNIAAMIFMIIVGGHVMGRFVVLTDLTSGLVDAISAMNLTPLMVIAALTLLYVVLGMVLDVWGMLILTVPFVFPVIVDVGIDPIWFGIYVVMMVELALITPPVGVNVYVMAKVAPDIPLTEIFIGVLPFFLTALVVIAGLSVFRDLVTWLPRLAFG
jgi:tripartite ATP-independent transporter DctM subunit